MPNSSSLTRPLSTAKQGMVMKISESQISTISPNYLYLEAEFSIELLNWCRCVSFSSSSIWSLARDQAFSKSPITSWSSLLFLSIGSTTSMFSEYFLNSILNRLNVFLTYSETFLMAAVLEILEASYSALIRTSSLKSSRPFPCTFVTGLISHSLCTSYFLTSLMSPLISPLSSYWRVCSCWTACVTNLLASFSITMSSKT